MKNLIVRTISGVLFLAIMITGIVSGPQAMVPLFALITALAVWEFVGLMNTHKGVQTNRFISTVAAVYLVLAMAGWCSGLTPSAVFIPYLLTIVYLFVAELYAGGKDPLANWAYTALSQLYVALPLALANVLVFRADATQSVGYDACLLLCVFAFLWINDTGAYCSGSLFGRHKLFPRVSPGKTWEGSVGGGLLVLAAAAAVGQWGSAVFATAAAYSVPVWVGIGAVVVVFGTWGDLVESLLKRTIGIKDSGAIMPGHGGMLDRFDSSLIAIPAVVVYLYTVALF